MSSETFTAAPEMAPSALTEDQVSFARTIGMTGLMAVCLGILILILNSAKASLGFEIGNNVGFAGIVVGMAMMLYHASRDSDQLIRRLYGYVGGLGLPMSGLILSLLPVIISASRSAPEDGSPKPIISLFFPFGWACFLAGLFFLIPYCRNETEEKHRSYGLIGLGGIGTLLAVIGLGGGLVNMSFSLTYGVVMALLGLAYLAAFVNQLGGADLEGYKPAMAIGVLGVLVFVLALVRTLIPADRPYFIPYGMVMMALGLAYAVTSLFLVSDLAIVVLTRRELLAYFCSPIAYMLFFMSAGVGWFSYNLFVDSLAGGRPSFEPIIARFYFGIGGFFMLLFMVPALTMRSISEEKRTGTYEVLMCAPVSEAPVVLSKFLAAMFLYMLVWSIWLVYLIDLRFESGKVFEYRTLISFHLLLAATGAAFVAMGVFFSSLTKNQIIAAALTFFGMVVLLLLYIVADSAPEGSSRAEILQHLSFVHLWSDSLYGRVHLNDVCIQLSIAAFWLFLATKVLEARRWS